MKLTTKKISLTLATLLVMMLGAQRLQATTDVDIDVTQAHTLNRQGALLLDVREPSEYTEVHAPNATLIPLGQLSARLNEISAYKDKPIVVMCRSGRRSAKAVHLLQEAGYSHVNNIAGGILAWEKSELKVVRLN
ncbi:MAG: sulfurtransferase [Gallionellales bacterium RIFOXYD2_FULL_52_7]|nr:MAG: sulfurtransferase [Gallionellales bacterium RIFOXYD2_FULL_52_7]